MIRNSHATGPPDSFPDASRRSVDGGPERCQCCVHRAAALCRMVAQAKLSAIRPARLQRIRRDETIAEEGETVGYLAVLRRGYLRKEKLRPDGQRTLLALALPGDLVGEWPERPLCYSLAAATDAEICIFDTPTVRRMMVEIPDLHLHVMQETCDKLERQLEMVWQRGALTSRQRIISFLLMAMETMPVEPQPDGSVIVSVRLSRRDWADLSNTTVETISRTLRYLDERSLVTTVAPSRYRIWDLDLLARLAGVDHDLARDRGPCLPERSVLPYALMNRCTRPDATMAARRKPELTDP